MKVLIIGAAGFVGGHLIDYLGTLPDVEVFAAKLSGEKVENSRGSDQNILDIDILNKQQLEEALNKVRPDYIINLAAQSSVSYSWDEPAITFNINVIGVVNVLEAIRKTKIFTRLLLIGSAEEYGSISPAELPVNESRAIEPENPYAVSKASQEMAARMYVKAYQMDIIMVRAFNHIGPGQSPAFALPAFAKQIAEIEKGIREPVLSVGNLDAKRDFTDVRDIVRGYWELVQKGRSGEIYNIGSGCSYTIRSLLDKLISMSSSPIEVRIDPERMRPYDIPELRADIAKIQNEIHWQPQIDMDKTLSDTLNYWRAKC